ncbi:MAG: hypothetical protein MHPSP_002249, partial [Paramarteilia canceri]
MADSLKEVLQSGKSIRLDQLIEQIVNILSKYKFYQTALIAMSSILLPNKPKSDALLTLVSYLENNLSTLINSDKLSKSIMECISTLLKRKPEGVEILDDYIFLVMYRESKNPTSNFKENSRIMNVMT